MNAKAGANEIESKASVLTDPNIMVTGETCEEHQKRMTEQICTAFGVPPQLLGRIELVSEKEFEKRKSEWIDEVIKALDMP